MNHRLKIDPDIRRAHTPSAEFYRSREIYERQIDAIFARSWQLMPPDVLALGRHEAAPWTLLEDSLSEPLLVTRGEGEEIKVLSNVCTHRGHPVAMQRCSSRRLRCRYHGRTFSQTGSLLKCPGFEEAEDFPRKEDDLPEVRHETWGPLHFVRLDGGGSLAEHLQPVTERMGWWPLSDLQEDQAARRSYRVASHWALYCENYLEGFHIPYVHHALNKTLEFGDYRTELFDHCSLQIGIAAPGEVVFDLPAESADHGKKVGAYYFFVFPNTMLNFYPWGLSLNVVRPTGPESTVVEYTAFVLDPSSRASGLGADLHLVEMEDEEVVEAVQVGMNSRLYQRGRYSPTHESAVHHFHRFLARTLAME